MMVGTRWTYQLLLLGTVVYISGCAATQMNREDSYFPGFHSGTEEGGVTSAIADRRLASTDKDLTAPADLTGSDEEHIFLSDQDLIRQRVMDQGQLDLYYYQYRYPGLWLDPYNRMGPFANAWNPWYGDPRYAYPFGPYNNRWRFSLSYRYGFYDPWAWNRYSGNYGYSNLWAGGYGYGYPSYRSYYGYRSGGATIASVATSQARPRDREDAPAVISRRPAGGGIVRVVPTTPAVRRRAPERAMQSRAPRSASSGDNSRNRSSSSGVRSQSQSGGRSSGQQSRPRNRQD